jgi:hypothetical protein
MARQPTTIQKSATPIVPNSVSAIDALNKPAARASSMGVLFPMNAKPRPLRTLHYPGPYNPGVPQDNATIPFGQCVRKVVPHTDLRLVRQISPSTLSSVFAG